MPEDKKYFSEAKNNEYNVLNVLNITRDDITPTEINVEEGAPFTDGVDPAAKVSDYIEAAQAEDAEERRLNEENTAAEKTKAPESAEVHKGVYDEARADAKNKFTEAVKELHEETAIKVPEKEEVKEEKAPVKEKAVPASKRIRKPRFLKKATEGSADVSSIIEEDENNDEIKENVETAGADEQTVADDIRDTVSKDDKEAKRKAREALAEEELAEALAVQEKPRSICDELHQLETLLTDARSPIFHKDEVLVPRASTLALIQSLTAVCDVDASYLDSAADDTLIDDLISINSVGEAYRPLERARERSRTIISEAMKQADLIVTDAKTLSAQLLAEADAEIKEKFDAADEQINVRMSTAKEESSKKLKEARTELTVSRQRSVEILSKYLEKAEDDYQGYWERAEQTVMASLKKSESILTKAAEIYRREIEAIQEDREEINRILEELSVKRPR